MSSFNDLINQDKPVLIDFFATWCGPCKALVPVLEQVKDAVGNQATILKVDVDKNQALASKLNVRGVPTLVLYKKGKQLWRQSGVVPKTEIISQIEANYE